jgi:CRISPR/Cas system CSM-associated protein Csm3 (group 7 of RAMP superfamily)
MSRLVERRVHVRLPLRLVTGLHVGRGTDPTTDLPLAVDGRGRFVLPGTGLAGPMRDWVRRRFGEAEAEDLFGVMHEGEDRGQASLLLVEDAAFAVGTRAEVRDHVGIDRLWGVAADAVKFDRAVIARGSETVLHLALEHPAGDPAGRHAEREGIVAALLAALADEEISFGGATTRGLGTVRADTGRLSVEQETFVGAGATLDTLAALASGRRPAGRLAPALAAPRPANELRLRLTWQARTPVMVRHSVKGLAADTLPLVTPLGTNRVSLTLPGSAAKGALRAHAERLMRTVLGLPVASIARQGATETRHFDQIQVPLVDALFGRVLDHGDGEEPAFARGALRLLDCHSRAEFSAKHWNRVLAADDERELYAALGEMCSGVPQAPWFQVAWHVAIDRWTQAPMDGKLFSVLEAHGTEWQPLEWRLDFEALDPEDRTAALALLLRLLVELESRRLRLGGFVNQGMGALALKDVELDWRGDASAVLDGRRPPSFAALRADRVALDGLERQWAAWLERLAESTEGRAA